MLGRLARAYIDSDMGPDRWVVTRHSELIRGELGLRVFLTTYYSPSKIFFSICIRSNKTKSCQGIE